MLEKLVNYLELEQKSDSVSLLAPIVGMYTIFIKGFIKVDILVMKNTAQSLMDKKQLGFKFDLKGSLIGRHS